MDEADIAYLTRVFGRYYSEHAGTMAVPKAPEKREFGYQTFSNDWKRHVGLAGAPEMREFLLGAAPAAAYCSVSYYDDPGAYPVGAKGWSGADLIFDIDAKDLALDCRQSHSVHVCKDCSKAGAEPAKCCSGSSRAVSLPCRRCVGAARKEADMLAGMLEDEFGAEASTVRTYFSGNEGYHVHVNDLEFHRLKARKRHLLAEHVMERGVNIDAGVTTDLSRIFRMPDSLSSKSGMAKKECSDPFVDAVVLGCGSVAVRVDCPVQFELNGEKFGPYRSETAKVPEYAAVYMILKRLATVA